MNEKTEGANKIVTCRLLFSAQLFSFMIRFAFGVVAPVLMEMYRISPKAMGYVLSGWNWSYTAGLPLMGVIVDRFGPYIVLGVGSLVWGLFTVALPIAGSAVHLRRFRIRSLPIPRPRLLGYGFFVIVRLGELPSARWGIYTPISFLSVGFRVISSSSVR